MNRHIAEWLEREMCTTAEECDPTKPLILDEHDMLNANPDFSEAAARKAEYARRQEQLGTSFFVNFDPACNLHQVAGQEGDAARATIKNELQNRLMAAFDDQFPDDTDWPTARQQIVERTEIALCPQPQTSFNNGEVYLWIRGIPLKDEFIVKVMLAFKAKLEATPITVSFGGKDYEVLFYGWGFRYY